MADYKDDLPIAKPDEAPSTSFACPECGRPFPSAFVLSGHRAMKHGYRNPEGRRAKAKGSKPRESREGSEPTPTKLANEARAALRKMRAEAGAGLLLVVPVPATYIARTDDEVIDAAVRLAGRNARLLKALASTGDVLAAVILARWSAGMGVAVGVQFGQVAPDSRLAQTFGVDKIVEDLAAEGFVRVEGAPDDTSSIQESDAGTIEHEPERPAVESLA